MKQSPGASFAQPRTTPRAEAITAAQICPYDYSDPYNSEQHSSKVNLYIPLAHLTEKFVQDIDTHQHALFERIYADQARTPEAAIASALVDFNDEMAVGFEHTAAADVVEELIPPHYNLHDTYMFLGNGLYTYLATCDAVYSGLKNTGASQQAIAHSKTVTILDRIAKLHVDELSAFTAQYLGSDQDDQHPFIGLIEQAQSGGYQFKKGMPLDAYLPNQKITLKQTVKNGEKIGCPVTFKREHLHVLWSFYVKARAGHEAVTTLASRSVAAVDETRRPLCPHSQTLESSPQLPLEQPRTLPASA